MLYPKAAVAPSATSVSMLGARCHRLLKPLMKNFWLMTMTATVSKSSSSPMATWLRAKKAGTGQPHIMCPMEKYMSTSKNPSDAISRRLRTGVSRSSSGSGAACAAPLRDAPYPACCTAAITCAGAAVPSTPMELVSRLTEQAVTPGTLDTAFSTRALHAAQLMPVTLYCSMLLLPFFTSSAFAGWPPARRWSAPCRPGCPGPRRCGCAGPAAPG